MDRLITSVKQMVNTGDSRAEADSVLPLASPAVGIPVPARLLDHGRPDGTGHRGRLRPPASKASFSCLGALGPALEMGLATDRENLLCEILERAREHLSKRGVDGSLQTDILTRICGTVERDLDEAVHVPDALEPYAWSKTREEIAVTAGDLAQETVRRRWRLQDSDAADVVQRVRTVVLSDLDRQTSEWGSFRGFVFFTTLGAHKGELYWQKGGQGAGGDDQPPDAEGNPVDHPNHAAGLAELRAALAECVDALSVKDQELFRHRYERWRSPTEIAHGLGAAASTIRVRIHRMVIRLRECLSDKGFEPQVEEPLW